MTLFDRIVSEILSESVDVSKVNDAIDNTYEVVINYHSKGEDNNTGERLIQPVAYGTTKAGYPVIRAYQPYGDTTTKTPSWKFFRLDRIDNWKPITANKFNMPPGMGYEARLGKFNKGGDETMEQVFNIAKFGMDRYQKGVGNEKGVSGPVTKNDAVVNKGNTNNTNPTMAQEPNTPKEVNGPVTKQDVKKANGNDDNLDRLKANLANQDYITKAMNDAEYGEDNNEEQPNI